MSYLRDDCRKIKLGGEGFQGPSWKSMTGLWEQGLPGIFVIVEKIELDR